MTGPRLEELIRVRTDKEGLTDLSLILMDRVGERSR